MNATSSHRFDYRAADVTGAKVSGEIDALNERDAVDALRRRGLWVTAIVQTNAAAAAAAAAAGAVGSVGAGGVMGESAASAASSAGIMHSARNALRGVFNTLAGNTLDGELAVVVRAIATLLSAGVPLDRALAFAAGPATRADVRRALSEVRDRVRNGESLSGAIARDALFPVVFAPTLAAGEASGDLDSTLDALADHLDRAVALRARLRASLAYPALLGVASIIGVIVILMVVVPRFAELVAESGGTLPRSTRALIWASDATVSYGWLLALTVILLAGASAQLLSSAANHLRWDAFKLSLPVFGGFASTRAAAAYTGVLALALRSGVSILPSMRLARGVVENSHINARLAEAESRVLGGDGVAHALEGTLTPLTVRLLEAGEVGGDLADMANRASESADAAMQRTAVTLVALVEPALILLFGAIVGFVALALLQAIYGINASSL